jgi:hypothetical protein
MWSSSTEWKWLQVSVTCEICGKQLATSALLMSHLLVLHESLNSGSVTPANRFSISPVVPEFLSESRDYPVIRNSVASEGGLVETDMEHDKSFNSIEYSWNMRSPNIISSQLPAAQQLGSEDDDRAGSQEHLFCSNESNLRSKLWGTPPPVSNHELLAILKRSPQSTVREITTEVKRFCGLSNNEERVV